jgi:hypothetical protein
MARSGGLRAVQEFYQLLVSNARAFRDFEIYSGVPRTFCVCLSCYGDKYWLCDRNFVAAGGVFAVKFGCTPDSATHRLK